MSEPRGLNPEVREHPCRNPKCPYGATSHALVLDGDVVLVGLCERCIADDDQADMERRKKAVYDMFLSDVPKRMRDWTLYTYPDDPESQEARRVATFWLHEYLAGKERNLILYGPVGGGKTGLAIAVAREVAAMGVPVAFANWRNFLSAMRHSIKTGFPPDFQRLQRVPLLVLDDLGSERPTDYARDALATLVEARYGTWRRTIVTTNYSLSDLAARLGHDDPIVGERIVSRLQDDAIGQKITHPDRRR